ncbi:sulfotransferase [Thermoleophilia bacterium SCSIO 60948]|nr:sulfotransferase [Thermoleophilia bacterium SCSIO 60948]
MSGADGFPRPIFVGGVGRSGTHVMGRMLNEHPRYHWIPTEVRFHASKGGLPDLCRGETTLERFLSEMRGRWFIRGANARNGLQRVTDREGLEAALEEFEAGFEADREGASGRLIRRLLDPPAEAAGKPGWVEITGQTIEEAPFLLRLFPEAKFINMVRDGRAVVAGMLKKVDLTDDPAVALEKWTGMVEAADRAIDAVGADRVLTVPLDDLTAHDRDATLERVIAFTELDDPSPVRAYFEREISAERAHVGGWRERMAPADVRWVDRRYKRVIRQLHRDGVDWAPAPR